MKTEVRFLLAIVLMLVVLVGTNMLFPPAPPEGGVGADTLGVAADTTGAPGTTASPGARGAPTVPAVPAAKPVIQELPAADTTPEQPVVVTGPLYRMTFSTRGARLVSVQLPQFRSFTHEGPVELVPEGSDGFLGERIVVGPDTVDLRGVPFAPEPAGGVTLAEDGAPATLRFVYQHPTAPFRFEISYTFEPDSYVVQVRGSVRGLERPLVITELGEGLAYNEADSVGEARSMAYVGNHLQDGIRSHSLVRAKAPLLQEGPFVWAAFRSKFFVLALLAGASEEHESEASSYLGGMLVSESPLPGRVRVSVTQSVDASGSFADRIFVGPQEYARLLSLGQDLEEVNPYGYRFIRPIVRPLVSIITAVLRFFHGELHLGYGWVLIVVGVLMRIVLFPLNHKAMKAQLRNMAAQPLMKEIQAKYKDNPERLQKEMMKLYKEHGFNPLAGCLPMLLPWPVLIALFFVFQNTIELRGVPFLWLPDLSAPDPLYILPVFLGLSMFLMQWVSMRSIEQSNDQMKMMMYIMPVVMIFIFFRLASGLNLYYATANIATIPQQIWIANERKKMQGKRGAAVAKEPARSRK